MTGLNMFFINNEYFYTVNPAAGFFLHHKINLFFGCKIFASCGFKLQMKKLLRHISLFLLLPLICGACSKGYPDVSLRDNDPEWSYESTPPQLDVTFLATLKKNAAGLVYLWSNDRMIETNEKLSFTREQRMMVKADLYHKGEGYYAVLKWLEPLDEGICTGDASVVGSDGIDIELNSRFTEIDDGFLTIYYTAWWGEHPIHHDFYLVSGLKADDPYYLEFRHNAHGDGHYSKEEGIISFDINSLPPAGDDTKIIHLKWNTIEGKEVTASFEFKSRK